MAGSSLVGRSVLTLDLPGGAAALATLENVSAFENVDVEAETLPLHVRGTIPTRPTERVSLAISVNGVIAATTVSYLEQGEWAFASMIPEEALVPGANEVQVFVLDGVNDDAVAASISTMAASCLPSPADAACVSGPSMLSSSTCTLAHE